MWKEVAGGQSKEMQFKKKEKHSHSWGGLFASQWLLRQMDIMALKNLPGPNAVPLSLHFIYRSRTTTGQTHTPQTPKTEMKAEPELVSFHLEITVARSEIPH